MSEEKSFSNTSINWEMGINEKHFQSLINKEKNIDFYLHILNKVY